jgi:hypothetical protein
MNDVKLVAAFAENRPGQVARFTEILARAHVNIRWVVVASTGPFGVMKFLVNDPARACEALKQAGLTAKLVDALAVEVPDRPGGLFAVSECLSSRQINLENASGFIANGRAIMILEVPDAEGASGVLREKGFHVLAQEDMQAFVQS